MAERLLPRRGSPDWPTPEQWARKHDYEKIFRRQALLSYLNLCGGMGVVALALPFLLLAFGGDAPHFSISHYYHGGDTVRNILVGSLWATGIFLILFQGLSKAENRTLSIGGVAAISVAMNPVSQDQARTGFTLHTASALVFFACLAAVAVIFSRGRLSYVVYPPRRRALAIAYMAAGLAMIGLPTAVALLHLARGGNAESDWIFWMESFAIWAFAFFWFVKTYEYRLLLRLRWPITVL